MTLDVKVAGDLVYVLGETLKEMGASEYLDMFGKVGCSVPQVQPEAFMALYRALAKAIAEGLVASAHGIYRGGLGVHLAMKAMAGGLGMAVDLSALANAEADSDDVLLYSESAGRFIVTIDPAQQETFASLLGSLPAVCIGEVTQEPHLKVKGVDGAQIIDLTVPELKSVWQQPFGDLI